MMLVLSTLQEHMNTNPDALTTAVIGDSLLQNVARNGNNSKTATWFDELDAA